MLEGELTIEIKEVSITQDDAKQLIQELNQSLTKLTGSSGSASFNSDDVYQDRATFLVAYINGNACGCGALREMSKNVAEIKRVYARPNKLGLGTMIIHKLEEKAKEFGYKELVLETRKVNTVAVSFYLKNGYQICDNYGKYVGRTEAVCFNKRI